VPLPFTLRTFEKNVRPGCNRAMNEEPDVFGDWKNSRCEALEECDSGVDVGAILHSKRGQKCVRVCDRFFNERAKSLRVTQIEHANSASSDLVFVRWSDTATGRSDFLAR